MRELTKNEKILLSLIAVLIAGFLIVFTWKTLQRKAAEQLAEEFSIGTKIGELRKWIDEENLWQSRALWLQENPPPTWERDKSEADLVQQIQSSLAEQGIDILSQRIGNTQELGDLQEVSVQLTLKGTTEEIIRWLHEQQQPGNYISLRQLNLRADSDKENLRAEIGMTRHYLISGNPAPPATPQKKSPSSPSENQEEPDNQLGNQDPKTTEPTETTASPTEEPSPSPSPIPSKPTPTPTPTPAPPEDPTPEVLVLPPPPPGVPPLPNEDPE